MDYCRDGEIQVTNRSRDAARDFLSITAEDYNALIGRKPTIDEVLHCLKLAMKNEVEEFLEDGERYIVTDITAKRRRRSKR